MTLEAEAAPATGARALTRAVAKALIAAAIGLVAPLAWVLFRGHFEVAALALLAFELASLYRPEVALQAYCIIMATALMASLCLTLGSQRRPRHHAACALGVLCHVGLYGLGLAGAL